MHLKDITFKKVPKTVLASVLAVPLLVLNPAFANSSEKTPDLLDTINSIGTFFNGFTTQKDKVPEKKVQKKIEQKKPTLPNCYDPNNEQFQSPDILKALVQLPTEKRLSYCPEIIPTCYSADNRVFLVEPPKGVVPLSKPTSQIPPCATPAALVTSATVLPPVNEINSDNSKNLAVSSNQDSPSLDKEKVVPTQTYIVPTQPLVLNFENKEKYNITPDLFQLQLHKEVVLENPLNSKPISKSQSTTPNASKTSIILIQKPVAEIQKPKEAAKQIPQTGPIAKKQVKTESLKLVAVPSPSPILPATKGIEVKKEKEDSLLGLILAACSETDGKYIDTSKAFTYDNIHTTLVLNGLENGVVKEIVEKDNFKSVDLMRQLEEELNREQESYPRKIKLPDNCSTKIDVINGFGYNFDVKFTSIPGKITEYKVVSGDALDKIAKSLDMKTVDEYIKTLGCKVCKADIEDVKKGRIFPGDILTHKEEDSYKVDLVATKKDPKQVKKDRIESKLLDYKEFVLNYISGALDSLSDIKEKSLKKGLEFSEKLKDNLKIAYSNSEAQFVSSLNEFKSNEELQNNSMKGLVGLLGLTGSFLFYRRRKELKDSISKSIVQGKDSIEDIILQFLSTIPDLNNLESTKGENILDKYTLIPNYLSIEGDFESELWEIDPFEVKEESNIDNSRRRGRFTSFLNNVELVSKYISSKTLSPLIKTGAEHITPIVDAIKENPEIKEVLGNLDRARRHIVVDYKIAKKDARRLRRSISNSFKTGVETIKDGVLFPYRLASSVKDKVSKDFKNFTEPRSKEELINYFSNILEGKGYAYGPEHYIAVISVREGFDSLTKTNNFLNSLGKTGRDEYCTGMIMELDECVNNYNQVLGHITYLQGPERIVPIIDEANNVGIRLKGDVSAKSPVDGHRYIPASTITRTYNLVRKLESTLLNA